MIDPKNLSVFLYKINFLTARKDIEGKIIRAYYDDNQYVFNSDVDFGFSMEVHPAYRWALQPQNINLYNDISLFD